MFRKPSQRLKRRWSAANETIATYDILLGDRIISCEDMDGKSVPQHREDTWSMEGAVLSPRRVTILNKSQAGMFDVFTLFSPREKAAYI